MGAFLCKPPKTPRFNNTCGGRLSIGRGLLFPNSGADPTLTSKSVMLLNTYKRLPVSFARGQGCSLFDSSGQAYLDAVSGVAVCNLGHAHPAITETIAKQASRLMHVSNLVCIPEQEKLADELLGFAGLHSAFFSNSGSEANETAIKIARMWGTSHDQENPSVLCFSRAFHGRTLATIAAGGNPTHLKGFDPLPGGFVHCPALDLAAVEEVLDRNPSVVAVMIEPIQGEAGVVIHPHHFLRGLQDLARRRNLLFILDEVQTGAGRTGRYFNFLHDTHLKPDIVTSAKGLANGFPIGACLVSKPLSQVMNPGSHGCTFGGNPLACAVASKVVEILENDEIYANVADVGRYMLDNLTQEIGDHHRIKRVQGQGMMIGVEFVQPPPFDPALTVLTTDKILINVTSGKTIRLLPPLILDRSQADRIVGSVVRLVCNDALYAN